MFRQLANVVCLSRCWRTSLNSFRDRRWPPGGERVPAIARLVVLLAATPFAVPTDLSDDVSGNGDGGGRIQLEAMDATTLGPKYVLEQTTVAAVEAALRTSTQALLTYLRAQDDYRACLDKYVELSEYSLLVLGNGEEEERVGQAIIAARADVDDRNNYVLQLERLLRSTEQLVSAAVETALMLDMTFVATSGSQHHYLVEQHVNAAKTMTREKEAQVRQMSATAVRALSEHQRRKQEADAKKTASG